MVSEVADYRNRLEQLEEFKTKRGIWMDQEEAHKKEVREMKEDYESQMARLNEMQKNNELRWAEDIRRQKAAMEEKVRKEIERETSVENERMWKEHAQMRIDLKHQKALMKNYMAEGRKWKEEREKLEGELVVATSMQAAVMRKVKFVTKRLKISDKLDDMNANLAYLNMVSDELKKHMEEREDLQKDLDITRKFNKFVIKQVKERGAGENINNQLRNILHKKRASKIGEGKGPEDGGGDGGGKQGGGGGGGENGGRGKPAEDPAAVEGSLGMAGIGMEGVKKSAKNRLRAKIKALMPFLVAPKEEKNHTPAQKIEFKKAENRKKTILASRGFDRRRMGGGGGGGGGGGRQTKLMNHRGTNFMGATPTRPPGGRGGGKKMTMMMEGGGALGSEGAKEHLQQFKKRSETVVLGRGALTH
ncbi:hypothetical protein TrRE_jg5688 [Triparma retinervis]|uniref:Uncharacterized protein n=1 Tax=Triparma retinervis TaxID=2557542 RepID=A0A9W6ZK30_9STRA|nr:hypothetical protein TrRE_jg5688 [Triparma retinervis]